MTERMKPDELIAWLESDEARSRPYRAERLERLLATLDLPEPGMWFSGGSESLHAFEELRLAYIHGLYLATVLLSLTLIERELAGLLYAGGMNEAAKAPLERLLTAALERNFISETERISFDRLRSVRNSYAHFRDFSRPDNATRRSVAEEKSFVVLMESNALEAVQVIAAFIRRNRVEPHNGEKPYPHGDGLPENPS